MCCEDYLEQSAHLYETREHYSENLKTVTKNEKRQWYVGVLVFETYL